MQMNRFVACLDAIRSPASRAQSPWKWPCGGCLAFFWPSRSILLAFLLAEALLCTGVHQDEGRYGHDGACVRQGMSWAAFGASFRHVRAGQLVLWPSTLLECLTGSETLSWNVVAEAAVRHGERLV